MMRPRLPASLRWTSVALEIGIVVVGILIAFALDSWWDRRAAAAREQAHLRALRSDFGYNVEYLRHFVRLEERISSHALGLLQLERRGVPISADTAVEYLGPVFTSGRFEAAMGAYDAIIGSGELASIRDDSLRRALAQFATQLENRHSVRFEDALYLDLIRESTGRLQWILWDERERNGTPISSWDPSPLLRDPEFQDLLAVRYSAARDVAAYYRQLQEDAQAILARIDRATEADAGNSAGGERPPT